MPLNRYNYSCPVDSGTVVATSSERARAKIWFRVTRGPFQGFSEKDISISFHSVVEPFVSKVHQGTLSVPGPMSEIAVVPILDGMVRETP